MTPDQDPSLPGLEGFNTGITCRTAAEEAVRQAELKYRGIFDHSVHGIYQSTPEGRFLNANRAYARMLGYESPAEMIASCQSIERDYYADRETRDMLRRLLAEEGMVQGFESRVRRRDGQTIWTRENFYAVHNSDGDFLYFEGSVEDITDRKLAELALRDSEERYRRLFTEANDIVYTTDLAGNYTSINRAGESIIGYTAEEMRGMNFREVVAPENIRQTEAMLERKLRGEETTTCYETEIRTKAGERLHIELSTQLIRDKGGAPVGVQGIARDITARKRAADELRKSEERYRAFVAQSTEAIWCFELDAPLPVALTEDEQIAFFHEHSSLAECNDVMAQMYGYSTAEEIIGARLHKLMPLSEPQTVEFLRHFIRSGYRVADLESREVDRHGHIRYFLNNFVGLTEDGFVRRTWGTQRDVTEQKRAELALRESEERYRELFENANDVVYTHDLNGVFTSINKTGERVTGYTRDEACRMNIAQVVVPQYVPLARQMMGQKQRGDESTRYELEIFSKDGRRVPLEISTRLVMQDGAPVGVQGIARDITERKQAEEKLRHIAFHDALTGLPNRSLFTEHLRLAVESANRLDGHLFAVLFLDLDRFKVINDSLGHTVGDQLLVALARRLEGTLRAGDAVARLGGDEFAMLLNNLPGPEAALRVAERVQEELALPFSLSGHEVFAAGSIGIALSTTGYANEEDVLRDADTVMYRAKSQGKPYEVFDMVMHARVVAQMTLENDLRRAVERKEFCLHYQPIVALDSGRISGFEALVRWQHPTRGLIAPNEFIPIAEETGLIVPLGLWVLEAACRQMREWHALSPLHAALKLSVNLSGRQLSQHDLFDRIARVLVETDFDPRCLQLELTESVIMDNAKLIVSTMGALRDLGVEIAIDDFGTGYSSLSYLQRFPIHTLKIDRSFISKEGTDAADKDEIVRTIILLARNMGKDVVAEGVETEAQLARLRQLNCTYGQGYIFSRPLTAADTETLLRAGLESGLFLLTEGDMQAA